MVVANDFEDRSKNERLVREMTNQYCPYNLMNAHAFMWRLGLRNGLDRREASSTNACYLEGYKVGMNN